MSGEQVKTKLERSIKALTLRPALGRGTDVTNVRDGRGES